MTIERAFYAELAAIYDSWLSTATKALSEGSPDPEWSDAPDSFVRLGRALQQAGALDDLKAVLAEILRGQLHSVLVAFDGGSALAETTLLKITASDGSELPRNLHESFVAYLFETGRLK